jgi:hypothetical protein
MTSGIIPIRLITTHTSSHTTHALSSAGPCSLYSLAHSILSPVQRKGWPLIQEGPCLVFGVCQGPTNGHSQSSMWSAHDHSLASTPTPTLTSTCPVTLIGRHRGLELGPSQEAPLLPTETLACTVRSAQHPYTALPHAPRSIIQHQAS